jgi:hypothetical protein
MSEQHPPPSPSQDEADAAKLGVHGVTAELPTVTDTPHVAGTGAVGETLTCTMGNWTGEPSGYVYQWTRDGVGGQAGGSTYVIVAADVGHSIACVVTATNAAGSTTAPPSNAIPVTEGPVARRAEPHPPRSR